MPIEITLHGENKSFDDFGNPIDVSIDRVIFGQEISLAIEEHYSVTANSDAKKTIQVAIYKEEYKQESAFTVDGERYEVARVKFTDIDDNQALLVGIRE